MKLIIATGIIFAGLTAPVFAECQPDQAGNIIDLGDGLCSSLSAPVVNQTDLISLINNLSQITGFTNFFNYYRDQVNPVYVQFKNSMILAFIDRGVIIYQDSAWIRKRYYLSEVEANLAIVLSRYRCEKPGLTDKFGHGIEAAFDGSDESERSYLSLLLSLDDRMNHAQELLDRGDSKRLISYIEVRLLPAIELTENKLVCLRDRPTITSSDLAEAALLFYERLDRAEKLMQSF